MTLKRDIATIRLVSGRISFLAVANGARTIGIFSGKGQITVAPLMNGESAFLAKVTGSAEFTETFAEALLAFGSCCARAVPFPPFRRWRKWP